MLLSSDMNHNSLIESLCPIEDFKNETGVYIWQNLAKFGQIWQNWAKLGKIWQNLETRPSLILSSRSTSLNGLCFLPKSFWAPAKKGTKSCRTKVDFSSFVCPFIYSFIHSFICPPPSHLKSPLSGLKSVLSGPRFAPQA